MHEPFQEKLISFPERIRIQESINHCESFGGTLVITESDQDYIQVGGFIHDNYIQV